MLPTKGQQLHSKLEEQVLSTGTYAPEEGLASCKICPVWKVSWKGYFYNQNLDNNNRKFKFEKLKIKFFLLIWI